MIQLVNNTFAPHGIEPKPQEVEHPVENLMKLVADAFTRHGFGALPDSADKSARQESLLLVGDETGKHDQS